MIHVLHLFRNFQLALQMNVGDIYEVMMVATLSSDNTDIYHWSQP